MKIETKTFIVPGIVIPLLLIAFFTFLYFIANENKETVVMGACWSEDNSEVIKYEVDGPKECPPLLLDGEIFPLKVCSISYNDEIDSIEPTNNAVSFINTFLRFRLFSLAHLKCENANVIVTLGVTPTNDFSNEGGITSHKRDSAGKIISHITIFNTSSDNTLQEVLIHELLHSLGLGHDNWKGSIMYPVRFEENSVSVRKIWISDADKTFLKRYSSN